MFERTLYIIGNGFDLKHSINSGYDKFCEWLEIHNPNLFRKINLTYKITGPEWWYQFEQNLAEIPFNAIISRSYEDAHIVNFPFIGYKKGKFTHHRRLTIDMADEIFVINVGGYIGISTRSEIDYATAHGKTVNYLEPLNQ